MRQRRVADTLSAAVRDGSVPGLVASIDGPEDTLYRAAFGNLTFGESPPMREDTIFRIASLTKLVTSVAIMMLVEEGRVDLSRALADYLPGFRQPPVLDTFDAASKTAVTHAAARPASVRELLSHTGGYGYWFLDEPLRVVSGDVPDLVDPPFLMHEPGDTFAYSSSADVIGQIVPAITGSALDDFFRERIFEPLSMRDTGFVLPADRGRLAPIHRRTNAGLNEIANESLGNPVRGGGGLYSTCRDYMRLLKCLLRGGDVDGVRILNESSITEIGSNQIGELYATRQTTALPQRTNDFIFMDGSQRFGFGVMVETKDQPGRRARDSYGWGGIFNTYFWIDPASKLTASLWMQVSPFADPTSIEILQGFETAVYADIGSAG